MRVQCSSTPIFVATVTTGNSLDPEYSLRIEPLPRQNSIGRHSMGNNDAIVDLEWGAGVYDLFLDDVAFNCSVTPPNPRRLVLAEHDSISTTFEVECNSTVGDLTVTTLTTGSDLDANGYTVALDALSPRPIGLNGTETFTGVGVGTHTLSLGDVASNCTVVTGTQRTVFLPLGGSASVAFAIVCSAVVPLRLYTDDFTSDGNWTVSVLETMGSTGHSEHVEATGGNPGGYRWMKNDHSDPSKIAVRHLFNSGYDPGIEGPVSHIDYREDSILLDQGTAGTLNGTFVVVQSGTVYIADIGNISSAAWSTVSRSSLTPSDFTPAGLDFSAAGGAMQFGYVRSSFTTDQYGGDMRHGIDNWTVIVHKKLN
jgi:hypothetical protein